MRILHILPNSNYAVSISYIKFVNKYFDSTLHTFVFFSEQQQIPSVLHKYSNILYIHENKIIEIIKAYDKVILHSSFSLTTKTKLRMLTQRTLWRKLFWVAWGSDLYEWKLNVKTYRNYIINLVNLCFIKSINYFVGIFPPDIKVFKDNFKTNATTYYAHYVGALSYQQIKEVTESNKKSCTDTVNILIGHSSTPILNHKEVIDQISKYKRENIKIYLPLNYGDMVYGDAVEEHAKVVLGDKAVCFREMLSEEKYTELLAQINIAIFNTSRQIALGNITQLLYMGKKIYIPSNTVMYDFFTEENINISDYNEVENMTFDKFVSITDCAKGKQFIIDEYMTADKTIEKWVKVFDAPVK